MKKALILGCSKTKSKEPGAIHFLDRYRPGALFQILHQFERSTWPDVVVLSAQHGFLLGENQIFDYDQVMTQEIADRLKTSIHQRGILERHYGSFTEFTETFIAAGKIYRQVIGDMVDVLPQGIMIEAEGGIGEMRSQLKQWLMTFATLKEVKK